MKLNCIKVNNNEITGRMGERIGIHKKAIRKRRFLSIIVRHEGLVPEILDTKTGKSKI